METIKNAVKTVSETVTGGSESKGPMTAFPTGKDIPAQSQRPQPGLEAEMEPAPIVSALECLDAEGNPSLVEYKGADKLRGKKALITGGDSGIGRSVAVMFAREGANIAFTYVRGLEERDAKDTEVMLHKEGVKVVAIAVDYDSFGSEEASEKLVNEAVRGLGGLDILVNNAGEQHFCADITQIDEKQVERTFRSNILSMIMITKHAVPHLKKGSSIINTTSVTAYKGSAGLIDYSSTKGAIVSFTRALSSQLAPKGIRVNAVAPGPIWTALQVSSRKDEEIEGYGDGKCPLGRVGQPSECGTSFVFLASADGSFFTGQVLHPNGGYYMAT
ncbi:oxidoreductase [Planoprotostelium fungivorum]|uniref:Oxidoreductase n=1 Tax=Planoprotostelium fungivorum TaxID=1890364 RepID=A0A2P6NEY2_9EUKA|nr:oxidoreductase [Planoprotostelium fungivorum]